MVVEGAPLPGLDQASEFTDACRANVLASVTDAPFGDVLVPFFERGKMLRSALVFLATGAAGSDPIAAMPAAEAVELLHGASLIHDDIADEADERRGLPAIHRQVPPGTAIVIGDFLIFRALARLTKGVAPDKGERGLRAVQLLAHHAEQCCRGQVDELHAAASTVGDEDAYLMTARRKTASLFVVACQLGPVLTRAPETHNDALGRYGLALGTAFQIRDDLLDLVGSATELGKPVGNSFAHDRTSLAVAYLWQHGSLPAKARFRELRMSRAPLGEVARLLDAEGLLARVRATQRLHALDAVESLVDLPVSGSRSLLAAVAESLATRADLQSVAPRGKGTGAPE